MLLELGNSIETTFTHQPYLLIVLFYNCSYVVGVHKADLTCSKSIRQSFYFFNFKVFIINSFSHNIFN